MSLCFTNVFLTHYENWYKAKILRKKEKITYYMSIKIVHLYLYVRVCIGLPRKTVICEDYCLSLFMFNTAHACHFAGRICLSRCLWDGMFVIFFFVLFSVSPNLSSLHYFFHVVFFAKHANIKLFESRQLNYSEKRIATENKNTNMAANKKSINKHRKHEN